MGPFPERERTKKRSPSVVRAFQVPILDRLAEMENNSEARATDRNSIGYHISHLLFNWKCVLKIADNISSSN